MLRRALVVLLLSAAAATAAPAAAPESPAPCPAQTFRFEAPAGWQVEPVPGLPAGREACSLVQMLDEENVAGVMRVDAHTEPLAYPPGDDPAQTIFERYRSALVADGALEVDREPSWRNDALTVAAGSPIDRASLRAYPARRLAPAIPLELAFVTLHTPGTYFTLALITPTQSDQPEVWSVNQAALRQVLNSFDPTPAKESKKGR
jgi:hypothetical protein